MKYGVAETAKQTKAAVGGLGEAVSDGFRNLFRSEHGIAIANAKREVAQAQGIVDAITEKVKAQQKIAEIYEKAPAETKAFIEAARVQQAANDATMAAGNAVKPGVFGRLFKVGRAIVEVPFAVLVMKPFNFVVNTGTKAFRAYPKLAPVVAIAAAATGIASWLGRRRSEARMDEYAHAQNAAIQAAAMQEAASQQAPVSFKNTVSPEEAATLAARQQEGQNAPSHTAKVEAARTPVKGPEAAVSAAL